MAAIQYSTHCYFKNDLYRLSIVVNDNQFCQDDSLTSNEFIATDISFEHIKPSLTQITFELIDQQKKVSALPKAIDLHQLLNVVCINSISPRQQKQVFTSVDTININDISTPIVEPSRQTSYTTLNTSKSEVNVAQQTPIRQQFSFGAFFSTQTHTGSDDNITTRSSIRLSYVDVSNSIRWSIKQLELELENEELARDLDRNLTMCLTILTQRPHHLLVFVNPYCGKGKERNGSRTSEINWISLFSRL